MKLLGHYNQAITHLWGGNFYEVIGIARYKKDRWFGSGKLIAGKKGFDFEGDDPISVMEEISGVHMTIGNLIQAMKLVREILPIFLLLIFRVAMC